jgi:hypothetical protein
MKRRRLKQKLSKYVMNKEKTKRQKLRQLEPKDNEKNTQISNKIAIRQNKITSSDKGIKI